jgi:hypothetical protein
MKMLEEIIGAESLDAYGKKYLVEHILEGYQDTKITINLLIQLAKAEILDECISIDPNGTLHWK